jgi:predicted lipoprotein with Yx(FWY)xxD motif
MMTLRSRLLTASSLSATALLISACTTTAAQPPFGATSSTGPATQTTLGQVEQAMDTFGTRSAENGYWPESVRIGRDRALGSIIIDGEGFTLYRFDKDTASPSKSSCVAACVRLWPPVLVDEKLTFRNLDAGQLGVLTRQDGTQQLTIGGWPAYRSVQDEIPGGTRGQGVGGTWFVLGPDGAKAGASAPKS